MLQLLKDATESRRKCELMKEQETQLKQQVSTHTHTVDSLVDQFLTALGESVTFI